VLVGGQAVHFWTRRYKERVPELPRERVRQRADQPKWWRPAPLRNVPAAV
jgi:hypothetical protein